jgi:hypothetical protein
LGIGTGRDPEAGLRRCGAQHGGPGFQSGPQSLQGKNRHPGFARDGAGKQGVGKDQMMAQLKTDDLGWQFDFTGEQLDRFYEELSAIGHFEKPRPEEGREFRSHELHREVPEALRVAHRRYPPNRSQCGLRYRPDLF